jgi:crotonobetainyl-CoA:carnitine CoA-transferase CaiB-like acyl-CoA transferase
MERPDIPEDPRFTINKQRLAHRTELVDVLNPIFMAKPSSYWLEELEQNGISCGPINDLAQTFSDPHVQARGMRLEMEHPATGARPIALVASPIRMSETQVDYRYAPPLLGQHTDEVLRDVLELVPEEVAALRDKGTV